jgi:diguanylate cyclase (GGDEF)-like protein
MSESKSYSSLPDILVVGDIKKVLAGEATVGKNYCCEQPNILEAIEWAGKRQFGVIVVVQDHLSGPLLSILKVLRRVCGRAKIVLLSQMHEEPAAVQLRNTEFNGKRLVDDYLICPVTANKFFDFINSLSEGKLVYRQEQLKILEKLATEDELTGLKNRRYIMEFARQTIDRAKEENAQVTLLMFDIDNFKHYNDAYSHSVGDEILVQAAVLMSRCCRGHDVVGRIGGDEFAVLFWEDPKRKIAQAENEERRLAAAHPKEAVFIANRFKNQLKDTELHLLGARGKGVLTISGGLATFPRDAGNVDELFKRADEAMLEAKRSGKNRLYLVGERNGH